MKFGPFLAALFLAALSATAEAAAPPPGSYQNSCRNAEIQTLLGGSGTNLVAECQTRSGLWADTTLRLPCRGDIQNRNGQLACTAAANPFAPPRGSYRNKCRRIDMAGPILRAECLAILPPTWVQTSINVLTCRGRDIDAGPRGRLFCN